MNSEPTPPQEPPEGPEPEGQPLPRRPRRGLLRRVALASPWLSWFGAIAVAVVVGQGLGPRRPVPGEVERREVAVAAPESGMVLEVAVEPGQKVRAGDTLVRLDASALDRELSVALAELERLTAEVPARSTSLQADERQASYRLSREVELAALEVSRLSGELLAAQAELAQIDRQIARHERLLQQQLTTTRALEELQLSRATVAQRVEAYPSLLETARAHERAARSRLVEQRKQGGSEEVDRRLAPLKAAIDAQEQRVAQLQARIDRTTVKAPVAGTVAAVGRRVGESATLGDPLVTLLDQRNARVVAWIDEHRASEVALGVRATLQRRSAVPDVRTGQVVALGPAIVQVPPRFEKLPGVPIYARPIFIALDGDTAVVPGTRYDVILTEGAP